MFLQALLSLYTFCKMFEIVLPGEGVILLEFQKAIHFHHLFHMLGAVFGRLTLKSTMWSCVQTIN